MSIDTTAKSIAREMTCKRSTQSNRTSTLQYKHFEDRCPGQSHNRINKVYIRREVRD